MKILTILIVIILIALGTFFIINNRQSPDLETHPQTGTMISNANRDPDGTSRESDTPAQQGFSRIGLQTNTAISSIDQELIFSGGPGKDGIPALSNPKFTSVLETDITDTTEGILVEFDGEKRYYPYNILVWHEIANDSIGNNHIAVTFCPLCGSGIVFNREVDGEILSFGVSGLLYESNLLMYDTFTESLWSQALGEAVVGDMTGTELEILPMQLIPFSKVKENHPEAKVLSVDTGYIRNYKGSPYSGYEDTEQTFFPISVQDKRFPAKQIMYVIPYEENSIVFPKDSLTEGSTETFSFGENILEVSKLESEITASINGKEVPGYFEMWFSWAQHHQEDGIVWDL